MKYSFQGLVAEAASFGRHKDVPTCPFGLPVGALALSEKSQKTAKTLSLVNCFVTVKRREGPRSRHILNSRSSTHFTPGR